MQETRITKDRIRHHFTYSWWKYVLLIVAAVIGWNLIYTTTSYRAPKDRRLDVYLVTSSVPDETLNWMREGILARYPALEDSNVASIVYTQGDDYYGSIQLTTYIGAQEGDVILLPRERFEAFAKSGAFLPLDDAIADGTLHTGDVDLARGTVTPEEGERAVYGIPAGTLYGLLDHGVDMTDHVLAVLAYTANPDIAIDWVGWLVTTMETEKPEWLTEWEQQSQTQDGALSDIPSF